MPHNELVLPQTLWSGTSVPSPPQVVRLDRGASESIDGDSGGTWAPGAPIIIGGAGLHIATAGKIAGGLATGARAPAGAVVLPTATYPTFISGTRARSVIMPLRNMRAKADEFSIYDTAHQWSDESKPGGLAIGASTGSSLAYLVVPIQPRVLHATGLASVTLRFRVGLRGNIVPDKMPGFRLVRLGSSGLYDSSGPPSPDEAYSIATRANLTSYAVGDLVIPSSPNGRQFRCTSITTGISAGAQPGGFTTATIPGGVVTDGGVTWICETGPTSGFGHYFTLPRPTNVNNYYAEGQPQDIVMTPLAGGFLTAPTDFGFFVDILDGSQTSNIFHSLKFTYTAITSFQPPV